MESTSTVSPTSSPTTYNDKKGANINAESQQVVTENGDEVDAVWGKLDDKSPNYRSLSWVRAAIIMIKSQVGRDYEYPSDLQIGLGILGLPLVMDNVGLVPGIIIIVCRVSDVKLGISLIFSSLSPSSLHVCFLWVPLTLG